VGSYGMEDSLDSNEDSVDCNEKRQMNKNQTSRKVKLSIKTAGSRWQNLSISQE
jgi:hypothetical protein